MSIDPAAGLGGLAVSAFLSSTLLPGTSEIVLAMFIAHSPAHYWQAIGVATLANTLGGLTSYAIGRLLPQPRQRPRALAWAQRFGVPILALSWLPLIGDALCVASGWLRHNVIAAAMAIAAGKFLRYLALAEGARLLAR